MPLTFVASRDVQFYITTGILGWQPENIWHVGKFTVISLLRTIKVHVLKDEPLNIFIISHSANTWCYFFLYVF